MLEKLFLTAEPVATTDSSAQALLSRYFDELRQRIEGFDLARTVSASATELTPPAGVFLILRSGDKPVACGGLKKLSATSGEIKRMYVSPEARGRGVGRKLLEALEHWGRANGCAELFLDTSDALADASRLYQTAGYQEIPAYNLNPFANRWFRKATTPV